MESLAYIVVILLLIGVLSAPISMALTATNERWMHIVASIVSSLGVLVGIQFLLADVAIGAKLIGFSIAFFNLWAIARVIKKWNDTSSK